LFGVGGGWEKTAERVAGGCASLTHENKKLAPLHLVLHTHTVTHHFPKQKNQPAQDQENNNSLLPQQTHLPALPPAPDGPVSGVCSWASSSSSPTPPAARFPSAPLTSSAARPTLLWCMP
jgi:hypothetical protein